MPFFFFLIQRRSQPKCLYAICDLLGDVTFDNLALLYDQYDDRTFVKRKKKSLQCDSCQTACCGFRLRYVRAVKLLPFPLSRNTLTS